MNNQEFNLPENFEELQPTTETYLRKVFNLHTESKVIFYRIVGILNYLNVPEHTYCINRDAHPFDILILSFRFITLADHDGLLALVTFIEDLEVDNIKVIVTGLKKNDNVTRKIAAIAGMAERLRPFTYQFVLAEILHNDK